MKEGQRDLKSTTMSHERRSLGAYHAAPPFPTRKAPSPSSSRGQGKKEPCWGHVALDPIPGPRSFTIDNNMPFLSCGLSLYAIEQYYRFCEGYKTKQRKPNLAEHLMDLSWNNCSGHCVGLQKGQTAFSVWRAALRAYSLQEDWAQLSLHLPAEVEAQPASPGRELIPCHCDHCHGQEVAATKGLSDKIVDLPILPSTHLPAYPWNSSEVPFIF